MRTRVRTPGQHGVRERGFESLKYERLYREHVPDGLALAAHAEAYRIEYNTVRPTRSAGLEPTRRRPSRPRRPGDTQL